MHWYCALKTRLTHKFIRKCKNSCDIHAFIGLYFICQNIHPCVKRVFNAWYLCVKFTNLWMNEFHKFFILNSSHGKFAKYLLFIGNNLKISKKWNIQGSWNGTIVLTNKKIIKVVCFKCYNHKTMACNN